MDNGIVVTWRDIVQALLASEENELPGIDEAEVVIVDHNGNHRIPKVVSYNQEEKIIGLVVW